MAAGLHLAATWAMQLPTLATQYKKPESFKWQYVLDRAQSHGQSMGSKCCKYFRR